MQLALRRVISYFSKLFLVNRTALQPEVPGSSYLSCYARQRFF
jgi:hypothetical protein